MFVQTCWALRFFFQHSIVLLSSSSISSFNTIVYFVNSIVKCGLVFPFTELRNWIESGLLLILIFSFVWHRFIGLCVQTHVIRSMAWWCCTQIEIIFIFPCCWVPLLIWWLKRGNLEISSLFTRSLVLWFCNLWVCVVVCTEIAIATTRQESEVELNIIHSIQPPIWASGC